MGGDGRAPAGKRGMHGAAQGRPEGEIRGAVRGHGCSPADGQRFLARFGAAQPSGARDAGGRAHAGRRDGRGVGLPRNQPGAVRAQRRRHLQRVLRGGGQGGGPEVHQQQRRRGHPLHQHRNAQAHRRARRLRVGGALRAARRPGPRGVLRPRGNRGRAGVPLRGTAVDGGIVPGMPWRARRRAGRHGVPQGGQGRGGLGRGGEHHHSRRHLPCQRAGKRRARDAGVLRLPRVLFASGLLRRFPAGHAPARQARGGCGQAGAPRVRRGRARRGTGRRGGGLWRAASIPWPAS